MPYRHSLQDRRGRRQEGFVLVPAYYRAAGMLLAGERQSLARKKHSIPSGEDSFLDREGTSRSRKESLPRRVRPRKQNRAGFRGSVTFPKEPDAGEAAPRLSRNLLIRMIRAAHQRPALH